MTSHSTSQERTVEFHDAGEGVFWIAVQEKQGANTLSKPLIRELLQTLKTVRDAPSLKAVVLKGLAESFLQGGRESINAAIAHKLFQAIATFPCPVIAAMQGDATGAGFLLAALCDVMVCSREGRYGFTSVAAGVFPTPEEERLFSERFGEPQAAHLLCGAGALSGEALQLQQWRCPVVPAADVESHAHALAAILAGKSQRSLRLLKQHLARPMVELSQALKKA